jgi:hypothetical protein
MSVDFTLPASPFGLTDARFAFTEVLNLLPHGDVLKASDELNRFFEDKLTARQAYFVESYLRHKFDAQAAALDAGYTLNEGEAKKIGAKMLKTKYIQQAVFLILRYCREKTKFRFDADKYFHRLDAMATADIADFQDVDGDLKLPDCELKRAAVKKWKSKSRTSGRGENREHTVEKEVELYNAIDATKTLFALFHNPETGGSPVATPDNSPNSAPRVFMIDITPVPSGTFIEAPEPPPLPIAASAVIPMPVSS